MNKITAIIASSLIASTSSASACSVTESGLVAGWEQVSKSAAYAEMAFEREGDERRFDSWRHERPEVWQGAWKLENCELSILEEPGNMKRRRVFKVLAVTSECLYLQEDDGRKMRYRKMNEARTGKKTSKPATCHE